MATQQKGAASVLHFRLGLYDPDPDNDSVRFIGRRYGDSPADRKEMLDEVRAFNDLAENRKAILVCLGVFPVPATVPRRRR